MTGYIGKRINNFTHATRIKEHRIYYESSFAFTREQCREHLSDMLVEKDEYKIVKINFEEITKDKS